MSPTHEETIDRVEFVKDSIIITYTNLITSLILIGFLYHYYTNVYRYFKRRGIKGPLPWPIVGNLAAILFRDRMKLEREWSKQYGKLYGVFFGTKPRFIVNDAAVLRQICIKDFDAMPNHYASDILNRYQKNFIFFSQDDHWRHLRILQSPTFTSGKIKRMFRLLDKCADDLVLCFSEHLDNDKQQLEKATVNVKDVYSLYTMDAITTAAYTIKLNRNSNVKGKSTRNDFADAALRLFTVNIPKLFVFFVLPTRLLKLIGFNVLPYHYFKDLDNRLRPIVHQRIRSERKADDYLQILVDARLDDEIELNELDEKENHHAALTKTSLKSDQDKMIKDIESSSSTRGNFDTPSPRKSDDDNDSGTSDRTSKAKLTEIEVISSAIFLLIVGVETTATLLTNCTYALAFHPDIQHRLYEVIKSIAEFNSETGEYSFDYDKLTSCEYLDAVVSETLRNLAPVILADRVVSRDCYLEACNVQLRKGDELHLSYYSIMNNPEYWPDPLKFDPERFMGDNKKKIVPGSYCPFGLGPRHCLGMRFSLTEAKLAVAKVLMRFKFTPVPGTSFPPECGRIHGLSNLKIPQVEIVARA